MNFRLVAEQWDRIGQFYAAFPTGHATASAALQRLNRFQASNRFYAANRELGRALKTEFVLEYMSEPQLRAKVRRGLLKVEQLHALARAVYYGQRGRISAREVYDQVNACSCLTLILACIVYWQAREISRMTGAPDFPFDPDLLRHVSPIAPVRDGVLEPACRITRGPGRPHVRGPVPREWNGRFPTRRMLNRAGRTSPASDAGRTVSRSVRRGGVRPVRAPFALPAPCQVERLACTHSLPIRPRSGVKGDPAPNAGSRRRGGRRPRPDLGLRSGLHPAAVKGDGHGMGGEPLPLRRRTRPA